MFRVPLLVSGLNRQYARLGELLEHMEQSPEMKIEDRMFCYNRTRLIAANLKKLRRLERSYRRVYPEEASGGSGFKRRSLAQWLLEA